MGRVQGSRNKGEIIFKETGMLAVLTWVDKLSGRMPEDKPSLKINNFEWKTPPRPHSMYPRDYTSFLWCWNQSRCLLAFIPGCNSCKVEDSQPKLGSYLLLLWESLITSNGKEGIKGKGTGKRRNWKKSSVVVGCYHYTCIYMMCICLYTHVYICHHISLYTNRYVYIYTTTICVYVQTYVGGIYVCICLCVYIVICSEYRYEYLFI